VKYPDKITEIFFFFWNVIYHPTTYPCSFSRVNWFIQSSQTCRGHSKTI